MEIRTNKGAFCIDSVSAYYDMDNSVICKCVGWMYSLNGQSMDLAVEYKGKSAPSQTKHNERPDVVSAHPDEKIPSNCGFSLVVKLDLVSKNTPVVIQCKYDDGSVEKVTEVDLSGLNITPSYHYHLDLIDIDYEKISVHGWVIQNPEVALDGYKAAIVPISVLSKDNKTVSIERTNRKRPDIVDAYGIKDDTCGFEVKWIYEDAEEYVIRVGEEPNCFEERIKVEDLKYLKREEDRHYANFWHMIQNRDEFLFEDDKRFIKENGLSEYKKRLKKRYEPIDEKYRKYFELYKPSKEELNRQSLELTDGPMISIVVPTYNTPKRFLKEMIESVRAQSYKNWQLCIADGSEGNATLERTLHHYHKKDSRIVYKINEKNEGISGNTNQALSLSTGEYIALLDHDDLLAPDALYEVVKLIKSKDDADVIYTDEDKFSNDVNDHYEPAFKPDFNLDLFRSNNYICHFFVVKKTIVDEIRGFRNEFDGSQDYDFIFRCIEQARNVYHIPKVLYYWRCHQGSVAANPGSKMYAYDAGRRAIESHLNRVGVVYDSVEMTKYIGFYRVNYHVSNQKVSIIIPNYEHQEDLKRCVDSILEKTTYDNYEIIIVENNSTSEKIFAYYEELEKNDRIRVVKWPNEFNFSAINNFATKHALGRYFLFLNNDTEVIAPDWIEKMLSACEREDVGVVGAKLYFADDTIQHAGVIIGHGDFAGHVFSCKEKIDPGYFAKAVLQQDFSSVTAACMMVSKEDFESVGGFDEELKVAFNDIDFCLKIREKNKLVFFEPEAELYHYESKSRGYDVTEEKEKRFKDESRVMKQRWARILENGDPYYNRNLSIERLDYSLRD